MEAAAEHRLRAYDKQVRVRVCRGRAWVGDRDHGIGDVGTDAHDSAAVLTDEPFGWVEVLGSALVISAGLTDILGDRRKRPAAGET